MRMEQQIDYSIKDYADATINYYFESRIATINNLTLDQLLLNLNPYLIIKEGDYLVSTLLQKAIDANISSSEEILFENWLRGLAIFINQRVYGGQRPDIPGIDLEFTKDDIRYIVNIKAGPKWHNKSQRDKMLSEFNDAKRTLATSGSKLQVVAVNGCCYGRDDKPHKFPAKGTDYLKLCGQRFWEFISGDEELFIKIIEPLGHMAKERNDEFILSYSKMINVFTKEFADNFCKNDGSIDWERLVKFNSSKKEK